MGINISDSVKTPVVNVGFRLPFFVCTEMHAAAGDVKQSIYLAHFWPVGKLCSWGAVKGGCWGCIRHRLSAFLKDRSSFFFCFCFFLSIKLFVVLSKC